MPTETDIISFLEKYQLIQRGRSPWPSYNPQDFEQYRIHWDALFPRNRRSIRDGNNDWDVYGDDWAEDLGERFQADLQQAVSAPPPTNEEIVNMAESNRWDTVDRQL